MTKQYKVNDEVIGEIDDVIPRFIQNPVRSKIRLQYSYGARRLLVLYSTRTVQYSRSLPSNRTRTACRGAKGKSICARRAAPLGYRKRRHTAHVSRVSRRGMARK